MDAKRKEMLSQVVQMQVAAEADDRDAKEAVALLRRVLTRRRVDIGLVESLVEYWSDKIETLSQVRALNRELFKREIGRVRPQE